MVEPEMAYVDDGENMNRAENLVGYIVERVLDSCSTELSLLERDTDKLKAVIPPFPRITYDEAVKLLNDNGSIFSMK